MTLDTRNILAAITELRDEAGAAGHSTLIDTCDRALNGDEAAIVEALEAIGDALAANPATRMWTEALSGEVAVRCSMTAAIWWPSDEAAAALAGNRAATLAACRLSPMLGAWHD